MKIKKKYDMKDVRILCLEAEIRGLKEALRIIKATFTTKVIK